MTLSIEKCIQLLKAGARVRYRCCTFHWLNKKPGLQLSFLNFGFVAFEVGISTLIEFVYNYDSVKFIKQC